MRWLATVAAFALGMLGCRAVHMHVDPRVVASADAYDVSRASSHVTGSRISFGPWTMFPVTGEATSNWSRQALDGPEQSTSQHPYAFMMDGPGGTFEAECQEVRRTPMTLYVVAVDGREAQGKRVLACAFRREGAPAASVWALAVHVRNDGGFAGELRDPKGTAAYAVRSSHEIEGMVIESGRPVGFTLDGNGFAAVVETVGSGRVFLPRRAAEKPVLASAAAALLVFEADLESGRGTATAEAE